MIDFKVGQLLKEKGNKVHTIGPEETALTALQLMADKNIGALVVHKDKKITGIFSERDYARKVVLAGKASKETPVSDLMTSQVFTVREEDPLHKCLELFTHKHIRHLPVVKGDELRGIISIGDVVNKVMSEQQAQIKDLKSYISSGQ